VTSLSTNSRWRSLVAADGAGSAKSAARQRITQPRHGNYGHLAAKFAGKGDGMFCLCAGGLQRQVMAHVEQVTPVAAQTKRLHGSPHLDASVNKVLQKLGAQLQQIAGFSAAVEFT